MEGDNDTSGAALHGVGRLGTRMRREIFYVFTRHEYQNTKIRSRGGDTMSKKEVHIWERSNLTLEEAAAYFGIGINRLREMTNDENCKFVLWIGNKRMIKRKALEKFLDESYSI